LTSPSTPVAGDFRRLFALGKPWRRHRSITHLSVAAAALAVMVALAYSAAPTIQAGLHTEPREGSILPANVGVGVSAAEPVVLHFPGPMDPAAVASSLGVAPRTGYSLLWNPDASAVVLIPKPRWATDERYSIFLEAGTPMADGGVLSTDWRAAFTTQTAPTVVDLVVGGASGTATGDTPRVTQQVMASTGYPDAGVSAIGDDNASDSSAATGIGLSFSAAMDHLATQDAFRITPAVAGSFRWEGTTMWFVPDGRLAPGTRYAVSVVGARDLNGSPLGGDVSRSFTTRAGAQVSTVSPAIGAQGVTDSTVTITFTEPMDGAATAAAFLLVDDATGSSLNGSLAWSADMRTLTFSASSAFGEGRAFTAGLGAGAADADGNAVSFSWGFRTAGGAVTYGGGYPAVPASADSVQYALNQLNAARASYGFAALALDSAISAVSYGHAADMLANGYFSHDSLDGTTYKQRLTAGGISYSWSGENQCYLTGSSVSATLDWCQAQFWAEPYPGVANHKGNLLSPNYHRVGIGIATGGGRVYIVWDFTD
jgi:uncharacterized protein YkwD